VQIGELVYNGGMMEIGHLVLGVVLDIKVDSTGFEAMPMCRVFWVDSVEPVWYYQDEVERINATG